MEHTEVEKLLARYRKSARLLKQICGLKVNRARVLARASRNDGATIVISGIGQLSNAEAELLGRAIEDELPLLVERAQCRAAEANSKLGNELLKAARGA